MAYRGKIGFHFPNRVPANFDANDVKFLPTNGSSTSDLRDVDKVYALPAGATLSSVADLGQYLVWERVNSLTAGHETVVFEYTPTSNVSLTNIGIFTDSTNTNTTCNVAVYHESGLVVYRHNADTIDGTTTKYELGGRRHHIDGISGVVLKGGLKYYIQYTQETNDNHNTYYPAYFTSSAGKYKVWYDGTVQNKQTVADMSGLNNYIGELNDNSRIFSLNTGDFFIWTGSSNSGLTPGYCYVRSSVGVGHGYTFRGVIGNPATYENYTDADITSIMNMPALSAFIWYRNSYYTGDKQLQREYVYAKTKNTASITKMSWDDQGQWESGHDRICQVIQMLKSVNEVIITNGTIMFNTGGIGSDITLNSEFTIDSNFDISHPISGRPSTYSDNVLYCEVFPGYSDEYCRAEFHRNGHWYELSQSDGTDTVDYRNVLNVADFTSWLVEIGKNSAFLESMAYDDHRISATLRDNTTYPEQSGRKYYLEINGNEV